MKTKILEIRDRITCIPVLAIQLNASNEAERYLLSMAGYGRSIQEHNSYILLAQINGGAGHICCDPYEWGSSRTMQTAHRYIFENWNTIEPGDVIDVEFILGETSELKISERLER